MSTTEQQSLQNHARFDWLFMAANGIVMINLIVAIVGLARVRNFDHAGFHRVWHVVFSAALVVLGFRIRQYPLRAQDRVIRLEERLRLQALAPPEWHAKILLLTEDQLIGLRFASDAEVVALAQQALDEKLTRKQIKQRIRAWRPDEWRV
jgi:Family of unknown function (DUF6526)